MTLTGVLWFLTAVLACFIGCFFGFVAGSLWMSWQLRRHLPELDSSTSEAPMTSVRSRIR